VEPHFQLDTSSAGDLDVEVFIRVIGAKSSSGATLAKSSQFLIVVAILVQNRSASLASRQLRHRLVELYETHGSDSASAADNYIAEVPQNQDGAITD